MLQESARKAGFTVDVKAMDFGGTDAANFSKAGLMATTIIGLDEDFWRFWHSLEDTPDIIEADSLLICAEMTVQFIDDLERMTCLCS